MNLSATVKNTIEEYTDLTKAILDTVSAKGATAAEVCLTNSSGFSTTVRMGAVDTVEYHREKSLAVTVYYGQRKGSASSTDVAKDAWKTTLDKACSIAKYMEEDKDVGLAEKQLMAFNYPDLALYYPWNLTPEQAVECAINAEKAGFAADKRISNSDGTSLTTSENIYVYANSHGFFGAVPSTSHSLNCVLVGKEGTSMQREYEYTVARDHLDLQAFDKVAKAAADKTIKRLHARRIKTCKAPVIYAANVAKGLLGHLVSAVSGGNLYRQSTFLLDQLGKQIFPNFVHIHELPHLHKAMGSAPFDNEGVITQPRDIIKDGILSSYFLSSYSARKLGMQTTGNAGGVHNVTLQPQDQDLDHLIKTMHKGLLITEVMGPGVNIVTGDYSRGAVGFWVEHGEIQFPVEEITIASNLKNMFQHIKGCANDVDTRGSIRTGSIFIEEMMIAGE